MELKFVPAVRSLLLLLFAAPDGKISASPAWGATPPQPLQLAGVLQILLVAPVHEHVFPETASDRELVAARVRLSGAARVWWSGSVSVGGNATRGILTIPGWTRTSWKPPVKP